MRLAIANTIKFPVSVMVPDEEGGREVRFQLSGKRHSATEWDDALDSLRKLGGTGDNAFLQDNISGWSGQDLVVDDSGTPVPYGREAMAMLLSIPGMSVAVFSCYQRAQHASLTEVGRQKNFAG